MATYKKMLRDRQGNNIIPAFGGQIETDDLADGAITTSKIADSNITTAKIADSNITTAKIADSNITTAKIADGAITTAKIADGALAKVATTGSYNDLLNKPTIPTVYNAILTIQKNGSNVQTFTANSSTNKTANITVPTKTQLYTGGTHTTSTSTLSQAPSNFDYLFIDVINNDSVINTVIIPGNATKFSSETHTIANNALYIKWAQWNISGSTISRVACYESNGYSTLNTSNVFGVKRVVGVKIP